MSKHSSRIAASIVIIVVATAFLAIELNNVDSTTRMLSSTISTSGASSVVNHQTSLSLSSGISPEGLQLKMMVNSSTIHFHGAILAQIEVTNTLNRNVSAALPPEWNQTVGALNLDMADLNDYDYTCGQNPTQFLADFALLEGHYTAENISSSGAPLMQRTSFFNPPCPGFFVGQSEVTFLPSGDEAIITVPSQSSSLMTTALNATTFYCAPQAGLQIPGNCGVGQGLVGYWNHNVDAQGIFNFSSPAFTYFPPGEYTIVAFDAWNQYIYASFEVM